MEINIFEMKEKLAFCIFFKPAIKVLWQHKARTYCIDKFTKNVAMSVCYCVGRI